MPEYLAPGVYVEEIEIGTKPIEGVSTSTAGFVGMAEKGPLNKPTLVTSFAEYQRFFGGHLNEKDYGDKRWLPYAVEGFFQNGGKRVYIVRVASEAAAKAWCYLPDSSKTGSHTVLNNNVKAGTALLELGAIEPFTNGDLVLLKDGLLSEYLEINALEKCVKIDLNAELGANSPTGKAVTKLQVGAAGYTISKDAASNSNTLELNDVSNISEGDALKIDGDQPEICVVDNVSQEKKEVYLKAALINEHTSGAAVKKLEPADPPVTHSLIFEAREYGQAVYIESGDTALSTGDALQIDNSAYFIATNVQQVGIAKVSPDLNYKHTKGKTLKKLEPAIKVEALYEGEWGNEVKIAVGESSISKAKVQAVSSDKTYLDLDNVKGMEKGTLLSLRPTSGHPETRKVEEVINTPDIKRVILDNPVATNPQEVVTREFTLKISFKNEEEVFTNLSMVKNHSRYVESLVNNVSKLIKVEVISSTPEEKLPKPTQDKEPGWKLREGKNGIPSDNEVLPVYKGNDSEEPEKRTGLNALKNIDQVSIAAVPGMTSQNIQNEIISHCETMQDRFGILEAEKDSDLDEIQSQRNHYESKYAALYYPWVKIYDSLKAKNIDSPPSGHIAGVYARTDVERGVHKAPANEKINGVVGLERMITKGQQDILNPLGVNCIRSFPGRGIRIWGARTLSSNSLWKYVNVRRLFLYLEESINEGTQWVVFEPNDIRLWARVKQSDSQFLTTVWRSGALAGATPEEAFFVKCDRTTMTQDDIDNGRLICIIGVAPVKPAEFVIFRIAQWTIDTQ